MNSKCTNPPENWLDYRFEHVEFKNEMKHEVHRVILRYEFMNNINIRKMLHFSKTAFQRSYNLFLGYKALNSKDLCVFYQLICVYFVQTTFSNS